MISVLEACSLYLSYLLWEKSAAKLWVALWDAQAETEVNIQWGLEAVTNSF